MTIPVTEPKKIIVNGNDVATIFSFAPMTIFESADLVVTRVDALGAETILSEGVGSTNYAVVVSDFPGTGDIRYPESGGTPLPTGESLVMKTVLALKQAVELNAQGGYFPDVQETVFDRLVKTDIQQQELIDRALTVPIGSSSGVSGELPIPVADRLIAWNSSASGLTNVAGLPASVAVSPFMETVLDDANSAAAQATLGISPFMTTVLDDVSSAAAQATLGISPFMTTVLDDVSSAAAQATLGVSPFMTTVLDDASSAEARGTLGVAASGIPFNCRIDANIVGNDLVVSLKGNDGNDPNPANPVSIPFRSTTATTGGFTVATQTSPQSVTLPSTATLGPSVTAFKRCYVYALFISAASVELAISRQAIFDVSSLQSTTVITVGSDSPDILYSTTARTAVPVALIGVVEMTESGTPGQWISVDKVADWRPGMRKTGDIVQTVINDQSDNTYTTSKVPPLDDTIPQVSEVDAMFSQVFTVTDRLNEFDIGLTVPTIYSTISHGVIALILDSEQSVFATCRQHINGGDRPKRLEISLANFRILTPGSHTITVAAGVSAGNIFINRYIDGTRFFGGVNNFILIIREVYA